MHNLGNALGENHFNSNLACNRMFFLKSRIFCCEHCRIFGKYSMPFKLEGFETGSYDNFFTIG